MLTFEQLTFQVDDKILVNQANGQILPHDFIVLTGQSGSGKSLLLKLLASLLPKSGGEILYKDKTLQQLIPSMWRSQVAYVAQMGEMVEGTVLDNLKLPFSLKFYQNQTFNLDWYLNHLQQLGKSNAFLQQDSRLLSGGEKQLVNLLRTLQLQPTILLLDEPTAPLDDVTTHQVESLITTWYQANPQVSLVWISHEPTQIERLREHETRHWQMTQGQLQC